MLLDLTSCMILGSEDKELNIIWSTNLYVIGESWRAGSRLPGEDV